MGAQEFLPLNSPTCPSCPGGAETIREKGFMQRLTHRLTIRAMQIPRHCPPHTPRPQTAKQDGRGAARLLLLLTTALRTDRQLWRIGRVEGEPKGGEGTHTSLAWDPPFGLAVWEGGVGKPDLPGKPRAPASLHPRPTAPLQGLNQAAETSSGAQGLRPARCPWSPEKPGDVLA